MWFQFLWSLNDVFGISRFFFISGSQCLSHEVTATELCLLNLHVRLLFCTSSAADVVHSKRSYPFTQTHDSVITTNL